jgi:hypothetical protein
VPSPHSLASPLEVYSAGVKADSRVSLRRPTGKPRPPGHAVSIVTAQFGSTLRGLLMAAGGSHLPKISIWSGGKTPVGALGRGLNWPSFHVSV